MKKMMLLVSAFTCMACTLFGQARYIQGYLKDSATHDPITNGKVINITQKIRARTDSTGYFVMQANLKDFIFATAPSYQYDTVSYSMLFQDTITIYLGREGYILPTVTVTSRYTKYQLDSMLRLTEFEEMRGTTLNTVAEEHGPGFGLTINLDRFFKKKYRNKKEQEDLFNELERNEYVDYRFSPQLVSMYTGLKGDSLKTFIQKYNPGYKWLRSHPTNEDVLYYVNDKLKESKRF